MARIAITPRELKPISTRRKRWRLAGSLVREVAIACILLLFVGLLVVGVAKLRALPRTNVHTQTAPGKLDAYFSALDFVSANEGWIAETKESTSFAGPTVLYRTTDGGRTWSPQLTWDGPGPVQVRFSPDGKEGLVVGQGGVPLFRTDDGGVHWQRMELPPQVTQVALLYFVDAREGWIISYLNEAAPGFAGVFHTTDGGQHWTQTARLDVNQQFSYGLVGGSLQGSLTFRDSATGWFAGATYSGTNIPIVEPHLYITHDGGKTWSVQKLPTQVGIAMDSTNTGISLPRFANPRDGVLMVTVISSTPSSPDGAHQAPSITGTYMYSTSDGGDHWSGPIQVALPPGTTYARAVSVIDASHWFVVTDSGLLRTTDGGRHWQALSGALSPNEHILDVEFQTADTGWAEIVVSTTHPTLALYRTTDAGAHWTRLSVPVISG